MSDRQEALLELAAKRAARRPEYLGWILAEYLASEGKPVVTLQAELRCDEGAMRRLALCRRPRHERFEGDITRIATVLGLDGAVLAGIVRRVQALEAMAAPGVVDRGFLMAARERRRGTHEGNDGGTPD